MRERIRKVFDQIWREGKGSTPPVLRDETLLLETGFDSLAFAIFVARLDDELGFDPFTAEHEAIFPQTFGEFVAFYEKHEAK